MKKLVLSALFSVLSICTFANDLQIQDELVSKVNTFIMQNQSNMIKEEFACNRIQAEGFCYAPCQYQPVPIYTLQYVTINDAWAHLMDLARSLCPNSCGAGIINIQTQNMPCLELP